MIARTAGAFMRAIFILLLVATPSLLIPGVTPDSTQFAMLMALFLGLITFVEYGSATPIILTFRDAPPYNRMRFVGFFSIVFLLTILMRGASMDTPLAGLVYGIGRGLEGLLDFPYSPLRLMEHMIPAHTDPYIMDLARAGAAVSYITALLFVLGFAVYLRSHHWPGRNGAFNVLTNLPMFDPTSGGDIVARLKRGARFYIVAGLTFPAIIPLFIGFTGPWMSPSALSDLQLLVWIITLWACVPANMLMRGIAMVRMVALIEEKRRQRYTEALTEGAAFA